MSEPSEPSWRNLFVLCTGRCGSVTLARALGHCTNYTSGHETRTHHVGAERFAYPARHVEVDNRLSWLLGRLDRTFGKDALYIHLTRDPEAVAESFVKRADRGILLAYRTQILMQAERYSTHVPMIDFARDYVQTVNDNIALFLENKPAKMMFRLETASDDLATLWSAIGAEGDLAAALTELDTRHNAS